MNSRDPLPLPSPQEIFYRKPKALLLIKHPGRDEQLLSLPAFSACSSDPASTKMHYGVFRPLVLDACRVLTNRAANTGQGLDEDSDFLATDIEGHNRVPINDTPLDVDCYYFLGPPGVEANCDYPIVKTLSAFTFPAVLPDRWAKIGDALRQNHDPFQMLLPPAASQMSGLVEFRDGNCALTRWRDATQCAHLIPEAEEDWFIANHLGVHISEDPSIGVNHPANGVLLRADVRMCLDSHGFVFYPDNDSDSPAGDQRFVAYFVRGGFSELPELLHRRPATIHPDVPVQFLYARFAYAIINLPRQSVFFASIAECDKVKVVRAARRKGRNLSRDGDETCQCDHSSSTSSNRESIYIQGPREQDDAERDKRWRDLLFGRIPQLSELPDVDDPPETSTGSHVETPHMLRLRSEYMKKNPQVWQTSATLADPGTREDMEGFYADWLTRPDYSGPNRKRGLVIQVYESATPSACDVVSGAWTTALMNFVTESSFGCAHPRLTLNYYYTYSARGARTPGVSWTMLRKIIFEPKDSSSPATPP